MKRFLTPDYQVELKYSTPVEWMNAVLSDFDQFLIDHADCERKASSMAMSFVAKAPDKTEIIAELIDIALEELNHFKQVYKILESRGIALPAQMEKDEYMHKLMQLLRSDSQNRLLDRFLIASIVETRGAERFRIVAENIGDSKLRNYYSMLYKSEEKHGNVFIEMALNYYPREEVMGRLEELALEEAEICKNLPHRPALH